MLPTLIDAVETWNEADDQKGHVLKVALAAIATHAFLAYFEPWPHRLVMPVCLAWTLLFVRYYWGWQAIFAPAWPLPPARHSIWTTLTSSLSVACLFLACLLASIAVYRLLFHRLAHFPGPRRYALSKWSMVMDDLKGVRHLRIQAVHQRYGDIVRTGPREVSINDAGVVPAIYGAQSACHKGPWYRGIAGGRPQEEVSVYAIIDKRLHDQRRKVWNAALASDARSSHTASINRLVDQTLVQLERRSKPSVTIAKDGHERQSVEIDAADWCTRFTFDAMGIIGFSRSFDLIESDRNLALLRTLQGSVHKAQVIGHLPYLSKALSWLPSNPISLFKTWVRDAIDARWRQISEQDPAMTTTMASDLKAPSGWQWLSDRLRAPRQRAVDPFDLDMFDGDLPMADYKAWKGEENKDLMGHFLRAHLPNGLGPRGVQPQDDPYMVAEGMLLCVGGSDTTSAALTVTLFQLAQHRAVLTRILEEVQPLLTQAKMESSSSQWLAHALQHQCPWLNASIKESMRLYPSGLSGLQRVTPSEGLALSVRGRDVWIPGHVVVSTPPNVIFRDPINFSPAPNQFRPQRWIEPRKEERMNASACVPFGFGTTGCAGKALALAEMRLFLAKLVQRFDFRLADGCCPVAFEQGLRDLFTVHASYPLRLVLEPRTL